MPRRTSRSRRSEDPQEQQNGLDKTIIRNFVSQQGEEERLDEVISITSTEKEQEDDDNNGNNSYNSNNDEIPLELPIPFP
jgi:hypothetical protein